MFIKEFKPVQKTDEYKWKNVSYSPSVDPLLDQRLNLDLIAYLNSNYRT